MTKGKHARPGYYAKPKFKKSILFVLFSLIILCFILSFLNPVESLENKMASTTKESENNSSDSLNTANVTETAAEVEPVIVEPSEDDNLKILIDSEAEKYDLTDSNFSFFYYNIDDKKYYFYNEDAYFTAASTIKVPIAMYYYDEINSGNLSSDSGLLYASGCYEVGRRVYSFSIFCRRLCSS